MQNARLQPATRYRPCHSPPATPLRRPRTHIGQHTRNTSLLGVMGRCLTSFGPASPQQAATILHQFHSEEPPPSIREAAEAASKLQQHGFEPPPWDQLMNNHPAPPDQHPHEGPNIMKGWQQGAANACHTTFQAELYSCLDPSSQALLESQSGPHASRPFTTIPDLADTTSECHLFGILLLRRLRLPIPLIASQAGAVALSTPLATIVQLVPKQGSYAVEEAPSNEQQPEFAGKQEPG